MSLKEEVVATCRRLKNTTEKGLHYTPVEERDEVNEKGLTHCWSFDGGYSSTGNLDRCARR